MDETKAFAQIVRQAIRILRLRILECHINKVPTFTGMNTLCFRLGKFENIVCDAIFGCVYIVLNVSLN